MKKEPKAKKETDEKDEPPTDDGIVTASAYLKHTEGMEETQVLRLPSGDRMRIKKLGMYGPILIHVGLQLTDEENVILAGQGRAAMVREIWKQRQNVAEFLLPEIITSPRIVPSRMSPPPGCLRVSDVKEMDVWAIIQECMFIAAGMKGAELAQSFLDHAKGKAGGDVLPAKQPAAVKGGGPDGGDVGC